MCLNHWQLLVQVLHCDRVELLMLRRPQPAVARRFAGPRPADPDLKPEIGVIMPIVIAALVLVGGLCLLDLLLTFGVIRRLREQTEMLTAGRMPAGRALGLSTGKMPGSFTTVTTGGELVSGVAGLRLVAFFSKCSICPERVHPFAEYLRTHRVSRDSVLAVSVGSGSDPQPYLDELAPVARICVEPEDGALPKAFEVAGFPSFFLLGADGDVTASGYDPADLPEPVTV
jgi:hypothetical protein